MDVLSIILGLIEGVALMISPCILPILPIHNRYWPAQYLIDKRGYVQYQHFGEGDFMQDKFFW